MAGCARLAAAVLSACPDLCILASSRQALQIGGEVQWRVPSLQAPDPRDRPNAEGGSQVLVEHFSAIRLFVDRARSVRPEFKLTKRSTRAVIEICWQLDGIPLAIELAAALVGALTVEEIARRLNNGFDLLTRGDRSSLPRQQTLRATIDWSYNRLTTSERLLFRRLAVFAGGFTIERAEAVRVDDRLSIEGIPPTLVRLV